MHRSAKNSDADSRSSASITSSSSTSSASSSLPSFFPLDPTRHQAPATSTTTTPTVPIPSSASAPSDVATEGCCRPRRGTMSRHLHRRRKDGDDRLLNPTDRPTGLIRRFPHHPHHRHYSQHNYRLHKINRKLGGFLILAFLSILLASQGEKFAIKNYLSFSESRNNNFGLKLKATHFTFPVSLFSSIDYLDEFFQTSISNENVRLSPFVVVVNGGSGDGDGEVAEC